MAIVKCGQSTSSWRLESDFSILGRNLHTHCMSFFYTHLPIPSRSFALLSAGYGLALGYTWWFTISFCTIGNYQWPHSVFVKHIYYTSDRSWSTRVRLVRSWAAWVRVKNWGFLFIGSYQQQSHAKTIGVRSNNAQIFEEYLKNPGASFGLYADVTVVTVAGRQALVFCRWFWSDVCTRCVITFVDLWVKPVELNSIW